MHESLMAQLNSPDPEERRQAIIALGRAKDPAALPALANVYRNDPDPALRELALKAGRHIRDSGGASAAAPAPAARTVESQVLDLPRKRVPAADVERARGYVNQALDLQVRGQRGRAIEAAGRALDANPNLPHEPMFLALAMDLTSMSGPAAIDLLSDPVGRRNFAATVGGEDIRRGADATWERAALDVAIYGLVNAVVVFVVALVGFQALWSFFQAAFAQAAATTPGMDAFMGAAPNITASVAILYGVIYGFASVVMLLIMDSAVHLVATSVMGGDGTFTGLIRKTTLFYTVLVPISMLISLVPMLFMDWERPSPAFSLVSLAFSIGTAVYAGKLTGDAYDFGTGRGCASIFLGSLALVVAFVCCIFVLSMALAQGFQSSFTTSP